MINKLRGNLNGQIPRFTKENGEKTAYVDTASLKNQEKFIKVSF